MRSNGITVGSVSQMTSSQDVSVNWVITTTDGIVECRYVRRSLDYLVVYLSSQTGCAQGCRMCHLTATGQVKARDVSVDAMAFQAEQVLGWYKSNSDAARIVHYNFMARGEPLSSRVFLSSSGTLFNALTVLAQDYELEPKFLVSTIFPRRLGVLELEKAFSKYPVNVYYSVYSMDTNFRRRWLPNAMPPLEALEKLKRWQDYSGRTPKLHYAFIDGQNDSCDDVYDICHAVNTMRLNVDVNIVRYNPFDQAHGREASEETIFRNAAIFRECFPESVVQIVSRVGFDVKASCGMFVSKARYPDQHVDLT